LSDVQLRVFARAPTTSVQRDPAESAEVEGDVAQTQAVPWPACPTPVATEPLVSVPTTAADRRPHLPREAAPVPREPVVRQLKNKERTPLGQEAGGQASAAPTALRLFLPEARLG